MKKNTKANSQDIKQTHPDDHDPLGLLAFRDFGRATTRTICRYQTFQGRKIEVPVFTNQFWTSKQRAAHSLHEISYRACFKPQLPAFFIERLTKPGEITFDPMMGRGTAVLEAALQGRVPWGNDVNPLSVALVKPRLNPPTAEQIRQRLGSINFGKSDQNQGLAAGSAQRNRGVLQRSPRFRSEFG